MRMSPNLLTRDPAALSPATPATTVPCMRVNQLRAKSSGSISPIFLAAVSTLERMSLM